MEISKKQTRISTGERLEFNNFSNVTVEHLHRYAIVLELIKGKNVLDIASGEGYGSFLLSKYATSVKGVDIDLESIEIAKVNYKRDNLEFIRGLATKIPLIDNSVDVVISFETIEHLDQHEEMMKEIKRVLNSKGILIMSSPDKQYYTDKTRLNNIFHVKELYFSEFQTLINNYFNKSIFLFQKGYNFNSYISEKKYYDLSIFSGDKNKIERSVIEPLYNITVASDYAIYEIKPSFFDGKDISNMHLKSLLHKNIEGIKSSSTFILGKYLIMPIIFINKILKRLKLILSINENK